MATPRGGSSQAQNQARDAKRVWVGAGRGRPGLGPVGKSPQPSGRRVSTPTPSGWVFSGSNYFFASWSGTLDTGESLDTSSVSPGVTDDSSALLSLSGAIQPSLAGLYAVRWSLTLNDAAGGVISLFPSTTPTIYVSPAETATSLESTSSMPLVAGSNIYALLTNVGPVDGVSYSLALNVQPVMTG